MTEFSSGAENYIKCVSDQNVKWQSIMSFSEQLLQLAYQKNWPALLELHARRDELLEIFFTDAITEGMVDTIKSGINTIQQRDEEIIRLVQNNQQQLGNESLQLLAMKKRITGYLSAEGE